LGKIKAEDIKNFKVEGKVFDEKTLFAIYKLMSRGVVKTVESTVKEGKESVVLSGKDKDDNWLALKVYRVLHCDFKTMWKYLIADPRFFRVRKSRRHIILTWAKREFKNLKIAFNAGVSCPKPIAIYENVLVMRFIGEEGIPAPRLVDVEIEIEDLEEIYSQIVEEMKKMARAKLIHGDLSPFNILLLDKPYLIDFSQGITYEHPLASQFLSSDVKNINKFFEKKGVKINENLYEELAQLLGLKK